MSWWRTLLLHLRRVFLLPFTELRPRLPATPQMDEVAKLPEDLQQAFTDLGSEPCAALDAATSALHDFSDLRDVLVGPGAGVDVAADVSLLADAEDVLRDLLLRAPAVKTLAKIAARRGGDPLGQEAAGEALLQLRDQGRMLHELASLTLLWASSRKTEDRHQMQQCAERLSSDSSPNSKP